MWLLFGRSDGHTPSCVTSEGSIERTDNWRCTDIEGLGDETHEADTTFDTFLVAALCANLRASGPRVALREPTTSDI